MQRVIVLCAALSAACGGDGTGRTDGGASDAGASDAGTTSCELPARRIAGTAETDALADAPARCGQPAYVWNRDLDVGAPTGSGAPLRLSADTFLDLVPDASAFTRLPEHDVIVDVIEYTTQDRGRAVSATAAVAYPTDVEPGAALDVVLFLHGTSGFTDACAPSRSFEGKGLAALLASLGFVAVAPDYIGLKSIGDPTGFLHPYLVGEPTAIASLDSVRAASRWLAERTGTPCPSPRVALFGGSQGGHAALWVDRLAPYYAPEIDLVGGVATVPPADIVGQIQRALTMPVDGTANAIGMFGTVASWYGIGERLDEVFAAPYDTDIPALLAGGCDFGDFAGMVESPADVFTETFLSEVAAEGVESLDPWGCIVRESGLTTTTVDRIGDDPPSYGILVVLGEDDPLVHTPIERDAFVTLCDRGMPLEMLECEGAGHGEATFWALPEILDYIDARFAGEAIDPASRCVPRAPSRCRATQ